MQPAFRNVVAFLRNADITCGYNFLPRDIPYGNVTALYNIDIQRFRLSLTAMAKDATPSRAYAELKQFNFNTLRPTWGYPRPQVVLLYHSNSIHILQLKEAVDKFLE